MKSRDLYPSESHLDARCALGWAEELCGDTGVCTGDALEGTGPAITATLGTGHRDSPRDSEQGAALTREGHTVWSCWEQTFSSHLQ